jgi:osmoprotectant transport system permease protein
MSTYLAILGDFGDAVDFIFHKRESVGGGVQVGGPAELAKFGVTHLKVSIIATGIATAVAAPIGLYLGHRGKGQFFASSVSNIGRAVPILALIAFFIAYLGIGYTNVIAALTLLAIPPIFTNTYVGVQQVDREVVDAAEGMGMTGGQIVWKVRLPLALPTFFGGVRTSAVSVLATATIAPLANVQTLGEPVINPQTYGLVGGLGAAMIVALLTVICDAGLGLVQRGVTPRGIKVQRAVAKRKLFSMSTFLRREQPT